MDDLDKPFSKRSSRGRTVARRRSAAEARTGQSAMDVHVMQQSYTDPAKASKHGGNWLPPDGSSQVSSSSEIPLCLVTAATGVPPTPSSPSPSRLPEPVATVNPGLKSLPKLPGSLSPSLGVEGLPATKKQLHAVFDRQDLTIDSTPTPGRRSQQKLTPDNELLPGCESVESETLSCVNEGRDSYSQHSEVDVGDSSVRSSLLEEVLAEKKMMLLRSPDVMHFLQTIQQNVVTRRRQEEEDNSSKCEWSSSV